MATQHSISPYYQFNQPIKQSHINPPQSSIYSYPLSLTSISTSTISMAIAVYHTPWILMLSIDHYQVQPIEPPGP